MTPGPPGRGGVLVAVSGGADSTALAFTLADAGVRPLHLAHVSHGFRPEAAERESDFLERLARRLGVPLHHLALRPPPGFVPGDKIPEAWAREQRYAALRDCARRLALATIAVGHHAADRRETQLLHLLRGGGLRSLAGIAHERSLGGARLWRPLLDLEPERLKAELRARGQDWIEDSSNADLRLARNRVRHRLLPALDRAGDPLVARLDALAGHAARVLAAIERHCDRLLDAAWPCARSRCFLLPAAQVARLVPTLLRELLLRAAARLESPERGSSRTPRRAEIEQLARWLHDPTRRGRRLFGAIELERSRRFVALYDARGSAPSWRCDVGDAQDERDTSNEGDASDARWVPGGEPICVRPLADGDRLSRFAAALAPVERRAWPAVTVGGRIVWVPRLWSDEACRPRPFPGAVRVALVGLPDLRQRDPGVL